MKKHFILSSFLILLLQTGTALQAAVKNIPPYGATPNQSQLDWQDMEMYAFVHFTTNTFTGKEWGFGDESPDIFNPTDYDPEQIVKTLAEAGFKGVVLTCKHHDGFCLWPTKTTRHSVASSKWKNGKGNVVKDIAKACRKFGVKFGIYVSPWDRNNVHYGTPKYLDIYQKQIKELLTGYGPVFLIWHDGANGGDGYYGGTREKRSIDRSTYYKWPETWRMIKKIQPNTAIFSDIGPDARWIGNESGFAFYPCWATYSPRTHDGKTPAPGTIVYQEGQGGTLNGKFWIPAEADVSIRPGWFWHEEENKRVRTAENLFDLYFKSVGRGANLNLNVPPDRRGQIHENDQASLKGFSQLLKRLYSVNHALGAKVTASSTLPGTSPANVLDRKRTSFWMADKASNNKATISLMLPEQREFDVIRLAEPTQLGQRIRSFDVSIKKDGEWKPWVAGSSIGMRTLIKGEPVTTDEIKITILESDAPPALSEISLWNYPTVIKAPEISYAGNGTITISTARGLKTKFTTDGSNPTESSPEYTTPFELPNGGIVHAAVFSQGKPSASTTLTVPVASHRWKIVKGESSAAAPEKAIDGDSKTLWNTHANNGEIPPPQSIEVDMGEEMNVDGFCYTPRQDGNTKGIINTYEFYLSPDGNNWTMMASGEFSNIKSNPIRQDIMLNKPVKAKYFRFVAKSVVDGEHVSIADLGIFSTSKNS